MKVAVVGSTGGTGRQVVIQALERGHEVVALARRPDALDLTHDRLDVRAADVGDPASLARAITGSDAVISALGITGWPGFGEIRLYSEGGANLIAALREAGIERFLAVTSGGVEHDDPSFGLFYKWVLRPVFIQRAYDDMVRFEQLVRDSGLTWTIARPTKLTDDPPTPGGYRVSPRLAPPGGQVIARSDLAGFLLDCLEQGTWVGQTPTLAV